MTCGVCTVCICTSRESSCVVGISEEIIETNYSSTSSCKLRQVI